MWSQVILQAETKEAKLQNRAESQQAVGHEINRWLQVAEDDPPEDKDECNQPEIPARHLPGREFLCMCFHHTAFIFGKANVD